MDQSDVTAATEPFCWRPPGPPREGVPIVRKSTRGYAGVGGVVLLAALALTGSLVNANADTSSKQAAGVQLHAHLNPLNNAGTRGDSDVVFHGRRAHVDIDAFGLARNLPHAEHIHFGTEARHE